MSAIWDVDTTNLESGGKNIGALLTTLQFGASPVEGKFEIVITIGLLRIHSIVDWHDRDSFEVDGGKSGGCVKSHNKGFLHHLI